MAITVLIADDHALVREGIKSILQRTTSGVDVIAEVSNGKEVLEMAQKTPADLYILDISMPLLNGIETTSRLIRMDLKNKIIILSMHDDRLSVERAFKAGAKGYLVKETAPEEIVRAVHEVASGNFYMSPKISNYVIHDFIGRKRPSDIGDQIQKLTPKEKEVVQLVAEGFHSKEIAKQLNITSSTVQVHRKNIMRKLNIHKQTDLVRFAIKEGLVQV